MFKQLQNTAQSLNTTAIKGRKVETSKFYLWAIIFVIVFFIFTVYELMSTILGFNYLRKISKQYRLEELEGEGERKDAETSEGIRIRLLTDEEMNSKFKKPTVIETSLKLIFVNFL